MFETLCIILGAASVLFNIIQVVQQRQMRKNLFLIKTTVNQSLARCRDLKEKGLIGTNEREHTFVVNVGHDLREIERQIEEMLGLGLEAALRDRAGGWLRRAIRFLLPLAAVSYTAPREEKKSEESS